MSNQIETPKPVYLNKVFILALLLLWICICALFFEIRFSYFNNLIPSTEIYWLLLNLIVYLFLLSLLKKIFGKVPLGYHLYLGVYFCVVVVGYLSYRYLNVIETMVFRDMRIALQAGLIGWMGCFCALVLHLALPRIRGNNFIQPVQIKESTLSCWFVFFIFITLFGSAWYLVESKGIIPILMEDKNLGKALSMEVSPISQLLMWQGVNAAAISILIYSVSKKSFPATIMLGLRVILSCLGFFILTSRQHIAIIVALVAFVLIYRKPIKIVFILLISYGLLIIFGFLRYTVGVREESAFGHLFFVDLFGQLRFFPDLYEVFEHAPKLFGKTYIGALAALFPAEFFNLVGLNKGDYYMVAGTYAKELLNLKFSGGGVGISVIGELYINFGFLGVFTGIFILSVCALEFSRRLETLQHVNEYAVLYSVHLIYLSLFLVLASTVILPQYFYTILPLHVCVKLMRYRESHQTMK